jgi:hypothetical protein
MKMQIPNSLSNLEDTSHFIDVPKRVDGWGVQLKGNYYRLFKKMDGKLKWIHIGRKWNADLAKGKIKRFKG